MTPIRIAVIGAGHLGRIHTRLLLDNSQFDLIGAVDPLAEARAAIGRDLGVAVLADFREVAGRIEAAVIATPTALHHEVASVLLDSGVHLLVEKPITSTTQQADELVKLAESRQRVLQVGHVERFNPAFCTARKAIAAPRFIESRRMAPYSFRSVDVGVVLDLMIHDLDLVLSTVDSPVVGIRACGATVIGPHEDIAHARLDFANGCVANLMASRVSFETERSMHVYGPEGQTSMDLAERTAHHTGLSEAVRQQTIRPSEVTGEMREEMKKRLFEDTLPREELPVPEANPLADEHDDLALAIRQGTQPRVSGNDGLQALAVAEQIVSEVAENQWSGHAHGLQGPHFFRAENPNEQPQRRAG